MGFEPTALRDLGGSETENSSSNLNAKFNVLFRIS